MSSTSRCETCGADVQPGDWPFCGPNGTHERATTAQVIDDTVPGGARYFHNLGDTPIWVATKTELKTIMAERGLVFAERRVYNRKDTSPWDTPTRLKPGHRDPFLQSA